MHFTDQRSYTFKPCFSHSIFLLNIPDIKYFFIFFLNSVIKRIELLLIQCIA